MYTYESLEVLTKETLLNLAEYNDVPDLNMRMLKGDIIDAIVKHMKTEEKAELSSASVRVQRIRDSQEN